MRIVLLNEFFGCGMGYLENMLPKFLARLGAEVHVLAIDVPALWPVPTPNDAESDRTQELQPGDTERRDGYLLHVLPHKSLVGRRRMVGLRQKLQAIRPDIVQTTSAIGWIPVAAAFYKPLFRYKLFTGSHYHASVFPLATQEKSWLTLARLECVFSRALPGWLASLAAEKCYVIAPDCAEIAAKFFGVPRHKIELSPLGVDTEIFHPISTKDDVEQRLAVRRELGFDEHDIVCVYTGRLAEDKNPALLARAIAGLRSTGERYRGLFVGYGSQASEIEKRDGCVTHAFVPVQRLAPLYRAADIGVWPAQESLSMLDAAASGLPIIANHTMTARERLNGNGATYRLNDLDDLMRALMEMRGLEKRIHMGKNGAQKIGLQYSWHMIAKRRLQDYESALASRWFARNELLERGS
jgi:glycosyltransferase involved in cell wall biosynthesis